MGLRCIIGHDYGDRETTEHREERGNERVVTVEEFKQCQRCGHRKVMSENTEVRSLEPTEPETAPAESEASSTAGAIEDDGAGGDGESADGPPHRDEADEETDDWEESRDEVTEKTAANDDGVILESGDEEPDRERGEWPDAEEDTETPAEEETSEEWPDDHAENVRSEPTTDAGAWPNHDERDDEGIDAEATSGAPAEEVEFGGGLAPEAAEDAEGADAEATGDDLEGTAGAADADDGDQESTPRPTASGIERASSGPTPTERKRAATTDAILECPSCGNRSPTQESSLRPGDICPDCQRGYLDETVD